jgi:hypothetical protein
MGRGRRKIFFSKRRKRFYIIFIICTHSVFIYVYFFLFNCETKRKKRTQRKRNYAIFQCLRLRSAIFLSSATPNLFSLANLRFALQTVLGFATFASLAKWAIIVCETATKRVLSEVLCTEFTRLGRTLQIISERSYRSRGSLCHFLAGTRKWQIKIILLFQ